MKLERPDSAGGADKAQPAAAFFAALHRKSVRSKGVEHILLARVNNAGGDKHGARFQILPDLRAEQNDYVGNNVGGNHIKLAVNPVGQVALQNGVLRRNKAVERAVFQRGLDGERINVHADGSFCAEQKRRDGKDSAAAAKIQQFRFRRNDILQRFQAKPCGCMEKSGTTEEI